MEKSDYSKIFFIPILILKINIEINFFDYLKKVKKIIDSYQWGIFFFDKEKRQKLQILEENLMKYIITVQKIILFI